MNLNAHVCIRYYKEADIVAFRDPLIYDGFFFLFNSFKNSYNFKET